MEVGHLPKSEIEEARRAYPAYYSPHNNSTWFPFVDGYEAALARFQWVDAIANKPKDARGVLVVVRSRNNPEYQAITRAYYSAGDWCGIDYIYTKVSGSMSPILWISRPRHQERTKQNETNNRN